MLKNNNLFLLVLSAPQEPYAEEVKRRKETGVFKSRSLCPEKQYEFWMKVMDYGRKKKGIKMEEGNLFL